MKNIIKNEKEIRCIRRENAKRYKSNTRVILHTDAMSHDVIDRINTVLEIRLIDFMTEATAIGYGMINHGDMVDLLKGTSTSNNILAETG